MSPWLGPIPGPTHTHLSTVVEIRTLYPSEWSVPHPAGLAYRADATQLLMVDKNHSTSSPGVSTVVVLTPYEELVQTVPLEFVIDEAINIAFDNDEHRLFMLNRKQTRLAWISVSQVGMLDPSTLTQVDIGHLGRRDIQGMAFDEASNRLLLLDSAAAQVLSIGVADISLGARAQVVTMDLALIRGKVLRGLAIDPLSRHLFVLSREAQRLYELTPTGLLVDRYDLTGLQLVDPLAMVFAPSADLTDPPETVHLFIADSGAEPLFGQIVEIALN